ncbi:MAG: NAD-dependent epimerase/dehydratase family protein [Bacteroidetes bacterium]|nr:NAD-dependent epimerase/dehydratase family protein [Bacteroidota bacterium]
MQAPSHHLRIKVARIFNAYGPNMHPNDGRVVCNFIRQALRNQSITIYGDGSQSRSFYYVGDLIEAFIRLMNSADDFIGPVNTGNPNEFTIRELAEEIMELTGSRSELVYAPLPCDDSVQRQSDISLAKEELGWEPRLQLEEGLKKTICYFESLLSSESLNHRYKDVYERKKGILHCPSKVVYTFLRRAIEIEIGIAIVIEMK